MGFDDILVELGEFGKYQKRIYLLVCLPIPVLASHIFLAVFTLAAPSFKCSSPAPVNYTNDSLDYSPFLRDPQVKQNNECFVMRDNVTLGKCHAWRYDRTVYTSTVVTKFNWVCEADSYRTYASTVYVLGMLLGAAIFGPLADVFGRKVTFYIGNLAMMVCSIVTIWMPEFYSFCLFRMLDGIMGVPVFLSAYYLGLEMVGPSKRLHAGIVIEYFFASGMILLAGLAYMIRDWTYLQLAVSLPSLFFLPYWWLIPESPRWLLTQGRNKEAENIIRHAAKVNGVTISEKLLNDMNEVMTKSSARFWQVFQTPQLALRTSIMIFNWMVVSMCYYGLSLNTGNLNGNIYLNFLLCSLIEFPGYVICQLLLNRIGRKMLFMAAMLLGGFSCVATVLPVVYLGPDQQWVTVMLSLVGKLGAACAFATIVVFCGEMFPTVIRAQSTSMCVVSARVGAIVSSYIAAACATVDVTMGKVLPLVIFGGASIAAGGLSVLLPESLNKPLPETLKDFIHYKEMAMVPRRRQINHRENATTDYSDQSLI